MLWPVAVGRVILFVTSADVPTSGAAIYNASACMQCLVQTYIDQTAKT